jgi:crossover junction endodeoxyribonuclease RuvC
MEIKMNYIWGCDLSLSNSGIAIFDSSGIPICVFNIKTNPKEDYGLRLKQIGDTLLEYKDKYPPEIMIIENAFTRFNKATQALYRVRGIVEMLFWDIPKEFLAPTVVKKIICGNGKADKNEIKNYIRKLYPEIEISDNNVSDALAIGISYFKKINF